MEIDHVVLASADVEATTRFWRDEYGLVSAPGGRHEAWGTFNEIVPTNGTYIEIVGVFDPALAATAPFGQAVLAAAAQGDSVLAVALRTDDLAAVCTRLGIDSIPGARRTPDGRLLSWRLAGVGQSLTARVPFFIEWDAGTPHPGGSGAGAVGASISRVEQGGPVDELRRWVGGDVAGLALVGGEPGIHLVELRTDDGTVLTLPTAPPG